MITLFILPKINCIIICFKINVFVMLGGYLNLMFFFKKKFILKSCFGFGSEDDLISNLTKGQTLDLI
jgi:hypothetical protein